MDLNLLILSSEIWILTWIQNFHKEANSSWLNLNNTQISEIWYCHKSFIRVWRSRGPAGTPVWHRHIIIKSKLDVLPPLYLSLKTKVLPVAHFTHSSCFTSSLFLSPVFFPPLKQRALNGSRASAFCSLRNEWHRANVLHLLGSRHGWYSKDSKSMPKRHWCCSAMLRFAWIKSV